MNTLKKRFLKISALCVACLGFITLGVKDASNIGHYGNNNDVSNFATQLNKKASGVLMEDPSSYKVNDKVKVTINEINRTETSATIAMQVTPPPAPSEANGNLGDPKGYYVGYGTSAEDHVPAKLVYKVKVKNKIETRISPITKNTKNLWYDGIGALGQDTAFTLNCSVDLLPDEEILKDEFEVLNIVAAEEDGKRFKPATNADGSIAFEKVVATSEKLITRTFEELITMKYVGSSEFDGQGHYNFELTGHAADEVGGGTYYEKMGTKFRNAYRKNRDDIEKGLKTIRTRIGFSVETRFEFVMKDGTSIYLPEGNDIEHLSQVVNATTPKSHLGIKYPGVDPRKVDNLLIHNFFVYIDIFDNTIFQRERGSDLTIRFNTFDSRMQDIKNSDGTVAIPYEKDAYFVDYTLTLYLTTSLFILGYAVVSLVNYFYRKEKYKNDEFKKMRTKSYFSNNTLGLIATTSTLIALMAIVARFTILNTSFVVYNEIDIFIIAFGIAAIIFDGYFIKYFTQMAKVELEKRRLEKLNLLEHNSIDDGTLIIPKKEEKEK